MLTGTDWIRNYLSYEKNLWEGLEYAVLLSLVCKTKIDIAVSMK